MDIILSFGALACIIANFLHWRVRRQGRWHYTPATGRSAILFNGLLFAMFIAAILPTQRLIRNDLLPIIMAVFMMWYELHSIRVRHALKA